MRVAHGLESDIWAMIDIDTDMTLLGHFDA
jgi:hypothetical protein